MKFLTKPALDVHKEKHKKKPVPGYICETCQAVHRNVKDLKNHQLTHNNGVESVIVQECPLCGFITKGVAEVDMHMRQKHNMNILRCNKCDHIAYDKTDLQHHMDSHRGWEKSIACGHCNYSAGTSNELSAHINKRHKPAAAPSKECGHCEFSAKTDSEIEIHMKQKHKVNTQCRFFNQGRCDRPTTCRFKHDETKKASRSEAKETPKCTRGADCRFKKLNKCHYFHEDVGVQLKKPITPQPQVEQPQEKRAQRLWCQYQDTCFKGPKDCPFRHYETEFPKLPTQKAVNMFR